MNNIETEKYLICLYHVTRYFCTQKNFDQALIFFEYVKHHCINKNFQSDMYAYYIILFNNEVLKSATNFNANVLHNIVLVTLKMQTLVPVNDMSVFFNRVRSYCPLFKYQQITHIERVGFCCELLEFLESVNIPDDKMICDDAYKALLNVVNLIIYSITTDSKDNTFPCFVNTNLEQAFSVMRKLCVAKEYTDCTEILEDLSKTVIKDLKHRSHKDSTLLNECYKKLKALVKKYGLTLTVSNTYSQIAKAFRIITDYFQSYKHLWAEYLQPELQVDLIRICEIVGMVMAKNVLITDKCCNRCSLKTDMLQATSVTSFAGIFSDVSSRLNLQCPDELHHVTLRCLNSCCEYVNAMKQADCEKYLNVWSIAGTMMYNTSILLYRNKRFDLCKLYCNLFYKNAIRLEGMNSIGLCFENCLGSSLHLYATCFSAAKQNTEAMTYLSLVMLLYPTHRHKALQSWILLKSTLADDDKLKAKTVNNILAEQQEIIAQLLPDFAYEKHNFEEILMCELRHYVDNWPSKVAMNSVCTEICLLSNCVKSKTKAFILTWEKVIHLPDNDMLVNLQKTIDTVRDSDTLVDRLCLACLHYVLYQRKMSDVMNKNVVDMNIANIPLKSTPLLKPYEEPPNPNDKCDIVPAYYNIKIENVLPLFEILDKCLNLSDSVINSDLVINVFGLMLDYKFGEMIKQIAFEYRLQHFHNNMLRAWNLHMQYAKLFEDKIAILTSIGFILEYSDCSSKTSKKLELEAEKLIPELFDWSESYLETIITYYINKSAGYLRSNFIVEGYSMFVTAQKYKDDAAIDMELDIVAARLMHLASYYMQIPCAEKIMPHNENCLNIAQNAFATIAEYYKINGRKCSYLLSLVLDIALDNGYLYKWLRLPREVRCYTKESVLLAQKLILPIRTAQFLSLLAFVDLLDKQFDDCEVKLSGLTKILNYGSNSTDTDMWKPSFEFDESVEKTENLKSLDMECVLPMFQSVLDVPMQHRKPNNALGSPDLRSKPFAVPEFVKHAHICTCYKCFNVEYQRLVLDSVHLEAILNSYQGQLQQAQNYFNGGIMLYQQIRNKSKSFSPVEIKLRNKETITCVLHKQLLHSSCAFLLDYSYFLTRKWDLKEAQKVVNTIEMLMENRYQTNVFLWNEIWVQKLNLMFDVTDQETKSSTRHLGSELQNLVETVTSTTPENKISQPKIKLSISPLGELKPPKAAKKIIFKLCDSDDEVDSEKPKTPVVNRNQFFKIQTPGHTPAPTVPKIKVYSPKTVKSKRYKTSHAPNTPYSVNKDTENCKSEAKAATNHFIDKRMKLLTEKLKAETKSVLKERNAIETVHTGNQTRICKNLLDELEEVTDGVEGLALEDKTTSRVRVKANSGEGEKTKKIGRSTKVGEKTRRRIKIAPVSSSDSSSEEIGIRRSARNKAKEDFALYEVIRERALVRGRDVYCLFSSPSSRHRRFNTSTPLEAKAVWYLEKTDRDFVDQREMVLHSTDVWAFKLEVRFLFKSAKPFF
ncbi:hypothetical protein CBL_07096 [Carabus blaptoides fortunei]